MNWQQIRGLYPGSWVVIEAVNASTEAGLRWFEEMRLHGVFGDDFEAAWQCYKTLKVTRPDGEYYPINTWHETLHITVIDPLGLTCSES